MKEITVLVNQNIIDISIQEYGTQKMILQLIQDNQDILKSISDPVYAGMVLKIDESKLSDKDLIDRGFVSPKLVKFYQSKSHRPAGGDEFLHKKFKSFNSRQFSRGFN